MSPDAAKRFNLPKKNTNVFDLVVPILYGYVEYRQIGNWSIKMGELKSQINYEEATWL